MSAHDGPFHPDRPVDSLDELARYAGATLDREGDWVVVSTPEGGARPWSEQAAAFYRGMEGWVTQGEVVVSGQDGSTWGYRYATDGILEASRPAGAAAPGQAPDPPQTTAPEQPVPGSPEAILAAYPHLRDDDVTRPPGGGRTLLMVLLLVFGVVAIIGVALLASGMV